FFIYICLDPLFTLFPYTTLFRSRRTLAFRPDTSAMLLRPSSLICAAGLLAACGNQQPSARPEAPRNTAPTTAMAPAADTGLARADRKSTRLNSSHDQISYAVFCL